MSLDIRKILIPVFLPPGPAIGSEIVMISQLPEKEREPISLLYISKTAGPESSLQKELSVSQ